LKKKIEQIDRTDGEKRKREMETRNRNRKIEKPRNSEFVSCYSSKDLSGFFGFLKTG
jgi:hypothetical protein